MTVPKFVRNSVEGKGYRMTVTQEQFLMLIYHAKEIRAWSRENKLGIIRWFNMRIFDYSTHHKAGSDNWFVVECRDVKSATLFKLRWL